MPQIFFNWNYVGGNKELQEALADPVQKQRLYDALGSDPDHAGEIPIPDYQHSYRV